MSEVSTTASTSGERSISLIRSRMASMRAPFFGRKKRDFSQKVSVKYPAFGFTSRSSASARSASAATFFRSACT